ncbi:hypothetical protein [Butyrivibrio sp.]|uniref:hypothetical protein n=1 Tax=Butyrivibrio sp. TaxID=28121 RepID=UPI0025C60BB9|nr:hypothetical protein [Butyrivibrio sp.]MBQ7428340.1 hypothetical protein [Butyrivibrio sp.]MBQ9303643.1 hypothetical protein [Butyrivibrio sp.]
MIGFAYENGDKSANDYVIIMPAGFSSRSEPGEWGQIEKTIFSPNEQVKMVITRLDGLRLHIVAYKYDEPNKPDKNAFLKHIYSILNDTIQAGFEYDVLMHSDRGFGEFFDRTFPNTLCPANWKPKYYLKGSLISYDAPRKWVLKQEFPIEHVENEKAQAILYKIKN